MDGAGLTRLDATAQADLVRAGQVTPTELVEASIEAVERLDPRLGAVFTPTFDHARDHAAAVSARAPFPGVPILVKDILLELAGYPYGHGGLRLLRDRGHVSDRTTYLANGTVDGVVDFRGLSETAVQTQGQSVVITLPPARLGAPDLDLDSSRVVARDRGVVDRVTGALSDDPTSEREVALLAERQLTDAAAQSDVLVRAQDNTRALLTGLARSFGYADVTVRFDGDAGV